METQHEKTAFLLWETALESFVCCKDEDSENELFYTIKAISDRMPEKDLPRTWKDACRWCKKHRAKLETHIIEYENAHIQD